MRTVSTKNQGVLGQLEECTCTLVHSLSSLQAFQGRHGRAFLIQDPCALLFCKALLVVGCCGSAPAVHLVAFMCVCEFSKRTLPCCFMLAANGSFLVALRSHCRQRVRICRINCTLGPNEDRLLITGLHTVADLECGFCGVILGWKYVRS